MSAAKNNPVTLEKSLPSSWYVSPEIFVQEREAIFSREWFCAGREEELPSAGNFKVVEIAGENVLLVRTAKGEIKAHYNVCRHRGARLCADDSRWNASLNGSVNAGGIRCPYHFWSYSLDGDLVGTPFLKENDGFRKEELSLYPVGVETWGGFIFLNLMPKEAAAEKRTLGSQFPVSRERTRRYPLHDLREGKRIVYHVAANWKIIFENYNECYHCGPVHPELCEIVPAFKRAGGSGLNWEEGVPHREGAYTFTWTGTTNRAPFPGLSQAEKVLHKGELIYPNLMLSLACDHVAAFILWPLAPDRTRVECGFLFHPHEVAKPSFDPDDAVGFWDVTNRQDWAICERVQQGVSSRPHEFGFYAPMEDLSLDIRKYVMERLGKTGKE